MKIILLLLSALSLPACGAVVSLSAKEIQGKGAFDALLPLDSNGDASISLAELREARIAGFPVADLNGDGSLDHTEYSALQATIPKRKRTGKDETQTVLREAFAIADQDSNTRISLQEYTDGSDRLFAVLDVNGDGRLSARDFFRLSPK